MHLISKPDASIRFTEKETSLKCTFLSTSEAVILKNCSLLLDTLLDLELKESLYRSLSGFKPAIRKMRDIGFWTEIQVELDCKKNNVRAEISISILNRFTVNYIA